MIKGKKYISSVLLVCFSVVLGHSMIPHHHDLTPGHSCPLEQKNHEADQHPHHCHGFNDLAFFKTNIKSASEVSHSSTLFFAIQQDFMLFLVPGERIISLKIAGLPLAFGEAIQLRGPPVVV